MTAAFFDMDGTILSVNSGTEYLRLMWRLGLMPFSELLRGGYWLMQYKLGMIDIEKVSELSLRGIVGQAEDEMRHRCDQWYRHSLAPHISPRARGAIAEHRAKGHPVVLLTSATQYAAEPLAQELGITHVLCTRLEVKQGRFTGQLAAPICFGAGKVDYAEKFAAEQGIELETSYFYTDSVTDREMLARVGNPRVVSPDLRLQRLAKRRRWPVEYWH
jgi:HAD superfamily hydrolase (TIGR01490 family)